VEGKGKEERPEGIGDGKKGKWGEGRGGDAGGHRRPCTHFSLPSAASD